VAAVLERLQARDARGAALGELAEDVDGVFWRARRQPGRPPGRVLRRCHRIMLELCAAPERRVLIHGDLQRKNLMWRSGELVAIDPIPTVGDAAYDVALWALSVAPYEDATARARRMATRLGLDGERTELMTRAMSAAVALWPQVPTRTAALAAIASGIHRAPGVPS